ncbi:MAG: AsmA family protein, partial [Candidatus Gastranaerophilales bacterium]|nr:AsmA family protein [Candidatus Gastranaerophilales bacterium]
MKYKLNLYQIILSIGIIVPVVLLFLLYLGYLFVVPQVVDLNKYSSEVQNILYKRTAYPMELGKLRISLTWDFRAKVSTDKVSIKKPNSGRFIELGKSYLEVSLPELVSNRVVIKKININKLNADITRLESGKFDVQEIFKPPTESKYKVSLRDANVYVRDYNINITDNYIKPSKSIYFEGKRIKIHDFSPNKYIEVYATGNMTPKDGGVSEFDTSIISALPVKERKKLRLKGSITNFDPNYFIPYINSFSEEKIVSLAKKMNVVFDVELDKKLVGKNKFFVSSGFSDLKIATLKHGIISEYPGTIKLMGRGHYDNNNIYFNDFKALGDDINFKCVGGVRNYKSSIRNRVLDLDMTFNNSRAEAMAGLFPKNLKLKRNYAGNVIKHGVTGVVNGTLALKGAGNAPNMYGSINYNNVFISKIPLKSEGKIDFAGNLLFLNCKVFSDKDGITNVVGNITPFNRKFANLNINSNSIDFKKALECMLVLRDFFTIKMGPVYDMDFKGKGKLDLHVHGPFRDTKVDGTVETQNMTVKYDKLSKPAERVQGVLKFHDGKVVYDEVFGYTEDSKITAKGYTTLKGYSDVIITIPQVELAQGLEFVNASPLLVQTKEALKPVLKVNGKSDMKIHLVGTEYDLSSDGEFVFENVNMLYEGFGEEFRQVKGKLTYKNEDIYFDKVTGKAADSTVTVSGFIKGNLDTEMELVSDALNYKGAKDFVMKSPVLIDAINVLKDYTDIKGSSPAKIVLKGNLNKQPFESMTLDKINGVFNHKITGVPISLTGGTLKIEVDKVFANNISGSSGGINFKINGSASNTKAYALRNEPIVPDFELVTNKFELSKIKTFSEVASLPPYYRKLLLDFDNLHGYATVTMRLKPESYATTVVPEDVSGHYIPYNSFVLLKKGKIEISDNYIDMSNLNGVISGSPFNLNGFIRNIKEKPVFDVAANIDVRSNDFDKLRNYFKIPVFAGGEIPLSLIVKGNAENWEAFARIVLEKGSYLNYIADIGLPRDKVRLVSLDAKGSNDTMRVERLRIDVADLATGIDNNNNQTSENFVNLINIHGIISGLKTKKPYYQGFVIETNNEQAIGKKLFNTSAITGGISESKGIFTGGDFKAALRLEGPVSSPEIYGNVSFKDIMMPQYQTRIDTIDLIFNKKAITSNITNLRAGETQLNISATTSSAFEKQLFIDDLNITAKMINVDELVKIFSAISPVNNGKSISLPPFGVSRGSFASNELVIRNLITSNVIGTFNLTPEWLLTVSNIDFQSGNGRGRANVSYNFKSNELSSTIRVENMEANALATTLLNLPNEVYGSLSGTAQFSTRGKTPQELISNSNGYAEFQAIKGQFVRLGSLEYLLRASNVIQSGVGGFNINNIIDLVAPKKTGRFEVLRGKVAVKDGILSTDDITSSGANLSLFISGEIDMRTNYANLQLLGRLSKKIAGLLGPVGSISLNQFIDYIPGLGFLPASPDKKGIID